MVLALILLVTILMAAADALRDTGRKKAGKLVEDAYLLAMAVPVFLYFSGYCSNSHYVWWHLLISAVLFRMSLFRIVWNLIAGKPYVYLGTTSYFDIAYRKFVDWTRQPPGILMGTFDLMCMIFGVWIIFAI